MSVTPRATGGGDGQRADRPAAGHEDALSGATPPRVSPCSATASGSASAAARSDTPGAPAGLRLAHVHVIGERALVLADARVAATDAQRRPSREAVLALAAALRRPADDLVAGRPRRDVLPHRDHAGRELVALDRVRRAPPVDEHVEVAAAHAAVAHLEQHVAGPSFGTGRSSTTMSAWVPGRRPRALLPEGLEWLSLTRMSERNRVRVRGEWRAGLLVRSHRSRGTLVLSKGLTHER